MHPAENYLPTRFPGSNPNYGQAIANASGAMLLAVNMNYTNAQKEPLVVRLIQMGIDIYGAAINTPAPRHGVLWTDGGGHNQGRKMPMLFAGVMLNDTAIIERADHARYKIFQEDSQFFYMTASDVSRFTQRAVTVSSNSTRPLTSESLSGVPTTYRVRRWTTSGGRPPIATSRVLPRCHMSSRPN